MAKRYKLIDIKLMLDRPKKAGHFWDKETFDTLGYPVALCGKVNLYPRSPLYFMTPNEMKEVPFCQKCLSMLVK